MPRTTRHSRGLRIAGAALALGASLTLTGCGFDAQTLKPYTPANGVNATQGDLALRNVVIIADSAGQGRLSGSLSSVRKADSLAGVSGTALKPDGSDAGALTVGAPNIPLPAGKLVVLTDPAVAAIPVSSADLKPGLAARVQFKFGSGVVQDLVVPVVDASSAYYKTISPAPAAPAASASAAPSAAPSATPSK